MLPCAVITMTGSSASTSLTARKHAHAVAFRQPQIRQDERGLGVAQRGHRFVLVARFDHDVALGLERELEHRAQRVLVFDEEDRRRRCGGSRAHAAGRSQPAGTPARRASSSIAVIAFCLVVDFLLHPFELGQRGVAVLLDLCPLRPDRRD